MEENIWKLELTAVKFAKPRFLVKIGIFLLKIIGDGNWQDQAFQDWWFFGTAKRRSTNTNTIRLQVFSTLSRTEKLVVKKPYG